MVQGASSRYMEPDFRVNIVGTQGPQNFTELILGFVNVLGPISLLLMSLAVLVFFWGLVKFIFRVGGDEKALTEGKSLMIWGIIALFVMVSIWGIISFFYNDIGFGSVRSFGIPQLPGGLP